MTFFDKLKNLEDTATHKLLKNKALNLPEFSTLIKGIDVRDFTINSTFLSFFYGTSYTDKETLNLLQKLADEQNVTSCFNELLDGQVINKSENRSVLHHKTRHHSNRGWYGEQQELVNLFSQDVHSGKIKSFSGKNFKHVVQIGIGGSELGPQALYTAVSYIQKPLLTATFWSNIDPLHGYNVLENLDLETTIFIVASKSGSTLEVASNLEILLSFANEKGISKEQLFQNIVVVTSKGSKLDLSNNHRQAFYIDDNIGGRFSATSVIGGTIISLSFGAKTFQSILQGASSIDQLSREPSLKKNMALLSALIGVWERNYLNYSALAVIPYSYSLLRFVAHLQQLDCESNGKSVNRNGDILTYKTGPVVMGEPGTNSQHSFFQKLHQGTDVVPIQFIGFRSSETPNRSVEELSKYQNKLNANLAAQITAFALGQHSENKNKEFPGGIPTTMVLSEYLSPESIGALLAFYENKIMFQGMLWNINSFDQEGVELGKILTNKLLSSTSDTNSLLNQVFNLIKG